MLQEGWYSAQACLCGTEKGLCAAKTHLSVCTAAFMTSRIAFVSASIIFQVLAPGAQVVGHHSRVPPQMKLFALMLNPLGPTRALPPPLFPEGGSATPL